jgi:hypothetical protein
MSVFWSTWSEVGIETCYHSFLLRCAVCVRIKAIPYRSGHEFKTYQYYLTIALNNEVNGKLSVDSRRCGTCITCLAQILSNRLTWEDFSCDVPLTAYCQVWKVLCPTISWTGQLRKSPRKSSRLDLYPEPDCVTRAEGERNYEYFLCWSKNGPIESEMFCITFYRYFN